MRYADDIAIFCASERAAARVAESVIAWIERELKLPVNRDKSGHGPGDGSRACASGSPVKCGLAFQI